MEKNPNSKAEYEVVKASNEQIDILYETILKNSNTTKEERRTRIIFLAIGENEKILGRLIAMEKIIPPPLNGKCWFISKINVQSEFRWQGIASALLKKSIEHAKKANIIYLYGSADPTLQATMLYNKHNFCLFKYGKICDDVNKPLEYGNYHHMFFYRLDKTAKKDIEEQCKYRIIKADKEQLNQIFDEHILSKNQEYFKDKKDSIIGFTAVDENENTIGSVIGYADEMYAPINGTQWRISYLFVFPEFQRQKIASSLIDSMIKAAKEANVMQLTCSRPNEDEILFWYKNNFDIYFWGKNSDTGRHTVTAALRIL